MGLASNSPEVLIGPVAAATSTIRVGSGGIMLPHYSPLKVAESFGMLSALYPDRIDLGIGRANGTSPKVAKMLQRDRRTESPDDFREQMDELLRYTNTPDGPAVSLLGSSMQSAIWAAELGLPYVFADFINPEGAEYARIYRERSAAPHTSVALWIICAETDAEAHRLSLSIRMAFAMLLRGRPIATPTVERAEKFLSEQGMSLDVLASGRRFITGSPSTVKRIVEEVAAAYGAEEVFAVNIIHSHEARLRSYELLSEVFRELSEYSNTADPKTPPMSGPTIGTQNTGAPLVNPLF